MAFDSDQFKRLIQNVLTAFSMHLENPGICSDSAIDLLLGTAAQESQFGTYLYQIGGGPALGVFQMEPKTEQSIWAHYLRYHNNIRGAVIRTASVFQPSQAALSGKLDYQIIMARLKYLPAREPLPIQKEDAFTEYIFELAKYWKNIYNTRMGAGTVEEFQANYMKYVCK